MNPLSRRWLRAAVQLWMSALVFPAAFHAAAALGWLPRMHVLTGVRFGAGDLAAAALLEVCWLGSRTLSPALWLASLPFLAAAWWTRA